MPGNINSILFKTINMDNKVSGKQKICVSRPNLAILYCILQRHTWNQPIQRSRGSFQNKSAVEAGLTVVSCSKRRYICSLCCCSLVVSCSWARFSSFWRRRSSRNSWRLNTTHTHTGLKHLQSKSRNVQSQYPMSE